MFALEFRNVVLTCCCSDASKRKWTEPNPLANVFSYRVLLTRSCDGTSKQELMIHIMIEF